MKKILALIFTVIVAAAKISYAQCGTTNIAQGKTVSYSSQDAIHTAAKVVDGNNSSDWWPAGGSSASSDQWLTINLGATYSLCKVNVNFLDNTHHASNYKIQTSTDNTNWTDVATITGNSTVNTTHNIAASAQYVKVWMTAKAVSWSSYAITEIQVYESTNQAPTVAITSPANNTSFTAGNNITIDATATDADGTITKVEFFQNGNKIGEDAGTPFTYTWNNVSAGTYALTVVATDNSAGITTSSAINITVSSGGGSSSGWSLTGNSATTPGTNFLGTTDNQRLVFKTNNTEKMSILGNGNVGINTATPASELAVNGTITTKKLKVTQLGWADYVFDKEYKLMRLSQVEQYIKTNKHLPGVPAAAEVEKHGIDIGDAQTILLKKIEELTLYIIEQNKKLEKQQLQIEQQNRRIDVLQQKIEGKK